MASMKARATLPTLAALLVSAYFAIAAPGDSKTSGVKTVDFDRDIRPILSDTCFACHGPDEKQRMAKLRFDTKEGAFAKPDVIVPGDSGKSRLVQRITAADESFRMPPPFSGRTLTDKQITLLRRWIDEGAKWETHWAYLQPRRPELPQVSNTAWPRNAIDNFIPARLDREGLKPSPEAEEVDAFLADTSPDAYEKHVDRLLNSPHYGERMAMQWLDLARYADTHGYHIDSHRDMWPWRNWVIEAFNNNMPFDRFTIEQLAGDLLPHPTP